VFSDGRKRGSLRLQLPCFLVLHPFSVGEVRVQHGSGYLESV